MADRTPGTRRRNSARLKAYLVSRQVAAFSRLLFENLNAVPQTSKLPVLSSNSEVKIVRFTM